MRKINRSPVNSPHKGQWRGALIFPLTRVWMNGWVNNREASDLRRYHAHHDVTEWCKDPLVVGRPQHNVSVTQFSVLFCFSQDKLVNKQLCGWWNEVPWRLRDVALTKLWIWLHTNRHQNVLRNSATTNLLDSSSCISNTIIFMRQQCSCQHWFLYNGISVLASLTPITRLFIQ